MLLVIRSYNIIYNKSAKECYVDLLLGDASDGMITCTDQLCSHQQWDYTICLCVDQRILATATAIGFCKQCHPPNAHAWLKSSRSISSPVGGYMYRKRVSMHGSTINMESFRLPLLFQFIMARQLLLASSICLFLSRSSSRYRSKLSRVAKGPITGRHFLATAIASSTPRFALYIKYATPHVPALCAPARQWTSTLWPADMFSSINLKTGMNPSRAPSPVR